jgi:hypothetical protein
MEEFWIAFYGRIDLGTGKLFNLTSGGEGVLNTSIETRKKMSEKAKARPPRKQTDETKKKLSEIRKNIKFNDKWKAKLSESRRKVVRQPLTEEYKARRREEKARLKLLTNAE